jgi:hypothetical protein
MDLIIGIILLLISMALGLLIRKKVIPPISMEYLTATTKIKERLKNDWREISFVSNVFFIIAFFSILILMIAIFPSIKAFKFIAYILIGLLLIYVIYKGISHEINKDI